MTKAWLARSVLRRESAQHNRSWLTTRRLRSRAKPTVNFLPGPVHLSAAVVDAFASPAHSHRGAGFVRQLQRCRRQLCRLTNGEHVAILLGSGTLANDVIAGQLRAHGGNGLVLSNGEFGDRLVDHARRMGLSFDMLDAPWGAQLPYERVVKKLEQRRHDWLWVCHCETSTGVLNDLEGLKTICHQQNVALVADCISSIGAVAVDLSGVQLASCVSGKALASYPGLSMVYHEGAVSSAADLPRYLDLNAYVATTGVPFTTSSNLVAALDAALGQLAPEGPGGRAACESKLASRRAIVAVVRAHLTALGCTMWADEEVSSAAVISFVPPRHVDSMRLGEQLERAGVLLSYRSTYLVEKNTLQVCLMGACDNGHVDALVRELATALDISAQGSVGATAGKSTH